MKLLDIGEVAKTSGISPSALRYYEETGLICAVARRGLRRQYSPDVLLRLNLIIMGKAANFSLNEIAEMFGRDGKPDISRPLCSAKARELNEQINDLTALRDTLLHVASCPAPSHMDCPTFRRLAGIAGKRHRGQKNRSKRAQS
ncbi:MerR family transcriptional regulator [Raoultella sp. Lac2]|uniref:helix-turn-helix domain-containing protein n=1 Tax=Klebsiella/Raoultella group TaxID=2890311 RepID=UPI001033D7DE|nr:MerR family transcriptional regulator [Raoultella sp. Lac2]MXF98228.1 MerR family transcriptional regulator [Raoultella sp. Lac1]